jgi:hypothetical protein
MTPAFRTGRDGRRSWLPNRPAHRSAAGDDRRPSRIGRVGQVVYGRSALAPVPCAQAAARRSWWRSPARAGASARPATAATWPRPPRISLIT